MEASQDTRIGCCTDPCRERLASGVIHDHGYRFDYMQQPCKLLLRKFRIERHVGVSGPASAQHSGVSHNTARGQDSYVALWTGSAVREPPGDSLRQSCQFTVRDFVSGDPGGGPFSMATGVLEQRIGKIEAHRI